MDETCSLCGEDLPEDSIYDDICNECAALDHELLNE